MKAKEQKKLILSLIRDDLINCKLVNGLNEIGLHAENYFLHLSSTIFHLMGYKDDAYGEAVYEHYLMLTKRTRHIDISESHATLNDLVKEIYHELLLRRPVR